MKFHPKSLVIGIIIAFGAWCILWNPVEYMDKELGEIGLTILGIFILIFAWVIWKKKIF